MASTAGMRVTNAMLIKGFQAPGLVLTTATPTRMTACYSAHGLQYDRKNAATTKEKSLDHGENRAPTVYSRGIGLGN